ncbi:MAG: hypothetical protein EOP86_16105 [Verrucomicrobiaceae bacterium]|nr:MAG: hypothetical protein EOP86_16105 [Verrucomicrobiaceae bacterium]
MGADYINADGGHLPPGAASSTPSNLLAGYASKPAAEKATFRQCICPRHFTAATAADVKTLAEAQPGDTAGVQGSDDYCFLLKAADPPQANSWVNMLTNLPPP